MIRARRRQRHAAGESFFSPTIWTTEILYYTNAAAATLWLLLSLWLLLPCRYLSAVLRRLAAPICTCAARERGGACALMCAPGCAQGTWHAVGPLTDTVTRALRASQGREEDCMLTVCVLRERVGSMG